MAKLTALVAEDSRQYRTQMKQVLEAEGFHVITADDGEQALKIMEVSYEKIDVVVTDLMMPKVDGTRLAEENFKRYHLPMVAITGIGDAKTALELLDRGIQDFMVKPFEGAALVGVVKNAVARNLMRMEEIAERGKYEGNVAALTIPARTPELKNAMNWVRNRVEAVYGKDDVNNLLSYLYEFVQNAYEHGCLGVTEDQKSKLLDGGNYNEELRKLELGCKKNITITVSVLDREVAFMVSDEGSGFDYQKYLNFTQKDILERITRPNGRGIYMAKGYFDSIKYEQGGAKVVLHKSFED